MFITTELHVVEELTRTTLVDVNMVGLVSLVQLFVVIHGINVEINVLAIETPRLIIDQQTTIVGLAGARDLPTNERWDVDLGVLLDVVGSNSNIRTKRSTERSQTIGIRFLVN